MAKCWTCGNPILTASYSCSSCEALTELKDLKVEVKYISTNISELNDTLHVGFCTLSEAISEGLSEIASAVEWGFTEVIWQLQQQSEVLQSIDHTLKTPSETQANEWRLMAEELRHRDVLDEAEAYYLKAYETNPLDYRIYIGLAETYLRMSKFDKAKVFLERSLPHAPKGNISGFLDIPQKGVIYDGHVKRIVDFGAYVEILPGKEGLLHISSIQNVPPEKVTDVLEVGDTVKVKLIRIDDKGRFDLSCKSTLDEVTSGVSGKIQEFLNQGKKIEAIKQYRKETGVGLAEAKDAIDRIAGGQDLRAGIAINFDWRSYSYRIIGHLLACEEDYSGAVSALQLSVDLSPTYDDGHYDYAQYCAQMGNKEKCLSSLQKSISAKPLYWYLAKNEKYFDPTRKEVDALLSNIKSAAYIQAKDAVQKSENALKEVLEAVSRAKQALVVSKDEDQLKCNTICDDVKAKISLAKDKIATSDYVALLEARKLAEEAYAFASIALDTADKEKQHYQQKRKEKVRNAWGQVPEVFGTYLFIFGILGAFLGAFLGFLSSNLISMQPFLEGLILGIIVGFIYGIYEIRKELH